jgi:hypothetical protein
VASGGAIRAWIEPKPGHNGMLLDTQARFGTGRTSTYARDRGSDKDSPAVTDANERPIRAWIGPKLAILVPHTGFPSEVSHVSQTRSRSTSMRHIGRMRQDS